VQDVLAIGRHRAERCRQRATTSEGEQAGVSAGRARCGPSGPSRRPAPGPRPCRRALIPPAPADRAGNS
jgi:hypothetical protein